MKKFLRLVRAIEKRYKLYLAKKYPNKKFRSGELANIIKQADEEEITRITGIEKPTVETMFADKIYKK